MNVAKRWIMEDWLYDANRGSEIYSLIPDFQPATDWVDAMDQPQLHRRTPSAGDDEFQVTTDGTSSKAASSRPETPPAKKRAPPISLNTQPRSRVVSTPTGSPSSASPFRTNFNQPASPLRTSFSGSGSGLSGHSRNRSVAPGYSPPLHSPLSFSFPAGSSPSAPSLTASTSAPEASSAAAASHARRHSRLHSRNLSVFFPQPGTLPTNAISEDGIQEIEVPSSSMDRSSRKAMKTPLGAGFTFGARPPPDSSDNLPNPPAMNERGSSGASRRGHHHKHSMSHNFFSFLEPGANLDKADLHSQPTPSPISPWSGQGTSASSPQPSPDTSNYFTPKESYTEPEKEVPPGAIALATGQFILGSWLWVSGQQIGSLSCTGLGYWVVFDSMGVAVDHLLPTWLRKSGHDKAHRQYVELRTKTVFSFAQAVYLLFAAVYVCKEAAEHMLLSAGGEEGHHHHPGDENPTSGIEFPIILIFISLITLPVSAILFDTHASLVNTCGNRFPPLQEIIRTITSSSSRHVQYLNHTDHSHASTITSNPYICSPIFFSLAILFIFTLISPEHQRASDLVLAALIALVTFQVSYRACTVLGTVLLQTAPKRGLPGGKMESFLKAMREVERHPQVLHLPAPHIWQVSPTPASLGPRGGVSASLVVTLQLHVRDDLGDDDVLDLTKWAWERCSSALIGSNGRSSKVEVTVGVVRG